jgi:hypothetical protein
VPKRAAIWRCARSPVSLNQSPTTRPARDAMVISPMGLATATVSIIM